MKSQLVRQHNDFKVNMYNVLHISFNIFSSSIIVTIYK